MLPLLKWARQPGGYSFSSALRNLGYTKLSEFSNPLIMVRFSRNLAKIMVNLISIYSGLFELILAQI